MFRNSKLRAIIAGSLLAVAAAAGAFTIVAPASAQSLAKQLISFACFDNQQCIKITNASPTGKAIVGVAQNDSAILGRINLNTNTNPNPNLTDFFTHGGMRGVDGSANPMDTNAGVVGVSKNGNGVSGLTTCDNCPFGPVGVFGFDNSSTANGNVGVAGLSAHNIGVLGDSNDPNNGTGVVGQDNGGFGVLGLSESKTIAGVAVIGLAQLGNALNGGNNDPFFATLAIDQLGTGPLIHAYSEPGHVTVMALDHDGNLTITGTLTQHGTPMSVTRNSVGRDVVTYAPQQSLPTMEDVGEAQLIGGQAFVRLEPAFASAIDTRRSYLVFITPQGDANSLYVTQKTAAGFAVRERNGASNVAFDYRVVAQPYGSTAPRMPVYGERRNAVVQTAETSKITQILSRKRPHIR